MKHKEYKEIEGIPPSIGSIRYVDPRESVQPRTRPRSPKSSIRHQPLLTITIHRFNRSLTI